VKDKPKRIDLKPEELVALLSRLERNLDPEDFKLVKAMAETIAYLSQMVDQKGVSVKRLLRMIFGATTEKTRNVLKKKLGDKLEAEEENGAGENTSEQEEQSKDPPEKPKGHGRNAASEYTGADRIKVPHESLKPGDPCPSCKKGKLYELPKPAVVVRVVGQAPLNAEVYELQRLRCSPCGAVFTAREPEPAGASKYDETAVSMIALLKYGSGLPFNRLERLQGALEIPLPSSTQWDVIEGPAEKLSLAYEELIRQAAQGEVFHNDDTPAKILEILKERKEQEEKGDSPSGSSKRKGVQTTGIISKVGEQKIAVFITGKRHAGENLDHVLARRQAQLGVPLQMCDGLSSNIPKAFKTVLGNCLTHSRRKYVDVAENFPEECEYVIEALKAIYKNDALAEEQKMTPQERLSFHQAESGPLMDDLEVWLEEQILEKKVEPNSGLGEAISYMQNHWKPLTLFLREAGAPLDNNVVERALKKAILHRKNSYFFKTQHGADVGDIFLSLIYTCELSGVNPFHYLTELQRHAGELRDNPAAWMPWNYEEALGRSQES
jgi:hypothetical protein